MRRDPHILIRQYTDLEVRDMTPINLGGMGGHWRAEKFKACGRDGLGEVPHTRRVVVDQPNIITNRGLNMRGNGPLGDSPWFHAGEGTTTPSVSDTALTTWTASKQADANISSIITFTQSTAPYFGSRQRTARFAANFAGGAVNITELMIAPLAANANAHSRVLTLDGGGSPVAVPIDADEAFDVFYTLRNYPNHVTADGAGSVDISGTIYNYTIRAANVTTSAEWSRNIYRLHSGVYSVGSSNGSITVFGTGATLGAVTSEPSASSSDSMFVTVSNVTDETYSTDTFQRKVTYNWSLTEGIVTGGIKAMLLGSTWGQYQLLFDVPIPKTGSNSLAFPLTTVWSRHV